MTDPTEPAAAGRLLGGRYQLARVVAQGGMATVWEGHDKVLARAVAIKVLHAHLANDRLFLERFRREAISAARLAHPNVVATYDAGVTEDGTAFIVMELIRGRTLSAFSAQHRPLPVFVVLAIALQITDALSLAHRAGLIHRDIKPANVLVCDSQTEPAEGVPLVKVTDFGIAKAAEGLGLELTKTGMVLGTPKYLSPEQIDGREPDARADLYALGVVLFELLAGETPFQGPTELAIAVQHLNAVPPRVRERRPGVPPALDALVAALLAKLPADRPPSAAAVRQALAGIDPRSGGSSGYSASGPAVAGGVGSTPGGSTSVGGARPAPEAAGGARRAPEATGGARRAPEATGGARPSPEATGGARPSPEAPAASRPAPEATGGARPAVGGGSGRTPRRLAEPAAGLGPGVAPEPLWPERQSAPTRVGTNAPPRQATSPTRVGPRPSQVRAEPGPAGSARRPPPVGRARSDNFGPPRRKPNWAGRVVAVLVVAALVVAVVVLAGRKGAGNNPGSATGPTTPSAAIAIENASVFHVERDADNAATVGNAIDGNLNTVWATSHYFGAHWAGLRHGLGLAVTLGSSHALHSLTVSSPTTGWSAEVFVAGAIPSPAALAPWGPPTDTKQGIDGQVTTFNLGGRTGSAVLLWITDPGPANQAAVAELAIR